MADPPSSNGNNTLFVHLPGNETLAIRRLPDHLSLDFLKARIELVSGIHTKASHVIYGEVFLDGTQDLHFERTIRNGAIVKVVLLDELVAVYENVSDGNVLKLRKQLVQQANGGEDQTEEHCVTVDDKIFFALLVGCRNGRDKIVQTLTDLDTSGQWKKQCTQFGRTLAHVASASDQVKILSYLMEQAAPTHTQDKLGQSPLDIAVEFGAYGCERQLKQSVQLRKRNKDACKEDPRTRKVCWADNKKTGPGSPHNKSNAKSSTSRPTGVPSIDPRSVYSAKPGVLSGTSLSSRQGSSCSGSNKQSTSRSSVRSGASTQAVNKENNLPHSHKTTTAKSCNHKGCTSRPPFMAFRTVQREELRPVTVEFVPLDATTPGEPQHSHQHQATSLSSEGHCPAAPCSSLNNSAEDISRAGGNKEETENSDDSDADGEPFETLNDKEKILQKREELRRRYSRAKSISYRTQSAKYYRTKYHQEVDDMDVPKARPATAGPRYREWKTWLLEIMEQDAEKEAQKEQSVVQNQMNARAFNRWLSQKRRDGCFDEDSSSDDESPTSGYTEGDSRAYRKWMAKKKPVFEKMDKQREDSFKQTNDDIRDIRDRKITIFELGSFEDKPLPPAKPQEYARAYKTWQDTKTKYENWKRKKGIQESPGKPLTSKDIVKMRGTLMLDGITYHEWLGLKERERSVPKLNVHNIGSTADVGSKRRK